ncbi:MAG TPA: hypothetical protein VFP61_00625 [Acidimicrobiales bacterium]|nr:hypothetical protein [Acidimicrobiales bacterium]
MTTTRRPRLTGAARSAAAVAAALVGLAPAAVLVAPDAAAAGIGAASGITHVWQIQLENESESATYGCGSGAPDPYLCGLKTGGVFLPDFYATGHVSLDNYLAQAAGVPYNPSTASDCDTDYYDVQGAPDTAGIGTATGCVYPSSVQTIYDQLTGVGKTWQGLMEDLGFTATRETACGIPETNGAPDDPAAVPPPADATNTATAADQYAARHNPFVYFHSLTDGGGCANVRPLGSPTDPLSGLQANLLNPPSLTYITPNVCDDGHDSPCAGPDLQDRLAGTPGAKGAGGLTSADRFLAAVVPAIEASPAYQAGTGMIVITSDEGSTSDTSKCCGEVAPTGGGTVGAVLVSKALPAGVSTVAYNHFSLLRSYEDLFGITSGGADGKGHLLEAATANSFGPDVYDAGAPPASTPEVPLPVLEALPIAAVALGAGYLARRRARRAQRA